MIIQCKCKCGTEFEEFDKWGHRRRFVKGHQRRGKIPWNKGIPHSPETRQKMSENHADFKGENHPQYGTHLSDEHKKAISESKKEKCCGEANHFYGKHHSPKTRQLMSEVHIGIIPSDEARKNMSDAHTGKCCGEKNSFFGKKHSPKTKQLMSENRKGENHPNWQGGTSKLPYCPIWTPWFKKEVKERDNFQCQNPDCTNEITKNNLLCVHHIDYDKKNCSTNNLITLCKSCNNRANFNRDYWKDLYNGLSKTKSMVI